MVYNTLLAILYTYIYVEECIRLYRYDILHDDHMDTYAVHSYNTMMEHMDRHQTALDKIH